MSPKKPQPSSNSSPRGKAVAYACSECGGAAEVREGGISRHCSHDAASVQAMLSATVFGEGRAAS